MNDASSVRRREIKARLDLSREHLLPWASDALYREILEHVPISIWIEDWSAVKAKIDRLARRGVSNWRRYFERHPDQLIGAADAVVVSDVSQATLDIYRAPTKEAVAATVKGGNMSPSELAMFRDQLVAFADGATTFDAIAKERALDGFDIFTQIRAVIAPRHGEAWSRVLHTIEDITALKEAEQALRESEQRLAEAQRIACIGNWIWDEIEDRETYRSGESGRIFGAPEEKLFADIDEFYGLVHPDDRDRVRGVTEQARKDRTGFDVEYKILRPDGDVRHIHERAVVELDDAGRLLRTIGTVQDITDRKEAEFRLRHLAQHDPLTDLPNRTLFQDRLDQAIASAKRHNQLLAIHFLDLNRFKDVNDTLGHPTGDELLKAVSTKLRRTVREMDTVARLGGDEFAVIQTELNTPAGAATLARKIVEALAAPFDIDGHTVRTGTTIGIAVYPNDGSEVVGLLRNADVAYYSAKAKQESAFEFFSPAMGEELTKRKQIEEELGRAIEQKKFELHYQPQIDLASGRITGVEALVRWNHDERGVVPPDEFIPAAEASGLIRPLGEWILDTACSQARDWQLRGLPAVSVAVNLSVVQLQRGDVVDVVRDALERTGLAPSLLELEITETVMMDGHESSIVSALEGLHELGVKVAVDDFGTGYASLTYVRNYPVSKVKVDKSFVAGILTSGDDKLIVQTVISLGRGLGLCVTAEGIETEEQAELLKAWECDQGQGYHFGRPIPPQDLATLLERQQ